MKQDPMLLDTGLLSPVRAGAPVEAVVADPAWLQAMLDAEVALVRAQSRLGTVPPAAAEVIARTAGADRFDLRALALSARLTANPVVGLVRELTRLVREQDPAAAEYVHRGSTSQDIFDTAAMMVARGALTLIRADLRDVMETLRTLAVRHRDTPMAGRTLAMQAVPTTFGLKAAGWRDLVAAAESRVAAVLTGGLPVALGGSAGTLAGYLEFARLDAPGGAVDPATYVDQVAQAFAEECGLTGSLLPWHALRTPLADLGAALAFTAGALGKLATDVLTLSRTEVGEVGEPPAAGRGGSSAMPHKRNPVLSTMIRSAALQVPALSVVLTQSLLAEDERSAGGWHAEWLVLRECLRLTGGASHTAAELARGLEIHPERMRGNLDLTHGLVVSERIAAVLAPRLGKTTARQVLTEASAQAEKQGRSLADVLAEATAVRREMSREETAALCAPEHYLGAAAALVDAAVTQESE
ncbi:adenylosuccinate lyase family protein [Actinoplanes sp. LDG1-06]|uniref:Adenylosuccinate lyase family protein n=1 Tax=Paractinoplanes ovalisporus TaxID=2810368 RepID=A0ABS2AV78_9ACTN|nr:adenylosuccinate lyase family protein [Actinoplanes ovalisporus]MBM2623750.1 adenylosuccinate lyase family protein [Actinoplanes ovalisporus]